MASSVLSQVTRIEPTSTERCCVTMGDVDSQPNTTKANVQQTEHESSPRCDSLQALGESTSEMLIKCSSCDAYFEDKDKLRSHTKEYHPNNSEESRKCQKCYRRFLSLKEFNSHSCIKSFVCGTCGLLFKWKHSLLNHQLIHSKNEPSKKESTVFSCYRCDFKCLTKPELLTHQVSHRLKPFLRPKCSDCGSRFNYKDELAKHVCNGPDLKKFCCEFCGKTYDSNSRLLNHQANHSDERNFECDVCNKKFKSKVNLKAHMVYHFGERKHICEHCSKGFIKLHHLKLHLRLHTGETPYKCNICEKAFPWQTSLKVHMKRHEMI